MKTIPTRLKLSFFLAITFLLAFVLLFVNNPTPTATAEAPPPRTVFVHLFEWKWDDIAQECTNFLGPNGFSAVQVSPPNEHADHRLISGYNAEGKDLSYAWWARYQPVSYEIISRSGDLQAFQNMVDTCQAAGVDIYVDAIINHTAAWHTGVGIGGSTYDVNSLSYPMYSSWDFHNHCDINGEDYSAHPDPVINAQRAWRVQNCRLVALPDLNTGSEYVRSTIANYLQTLVDMGVAGFRLDAAKHMNPADIDNILGRVQGDFYVFQEVIDPGGQSVSSWDYIGIADVTEFQYSERIGHVFAQGQLAWFNGQNMFGEGWGFLPSDRAVVFVDNHDNQRGHGMAAQVTHRSGQLYDLANVFMLAWPYGYPKIMSSYEWGGWNDNQGPPHDGQGNTTPVYNADGTLNCFGNDWVCEHRWRPIKNMVAFRNYTASDFTVNNWWSNGNNQIAFSRGDKGFVVINREGGQLNQWLQTGLPAGTYCNVIAGDYIEATNSCTGPTVEVPANGWVNFQVNGMDAVALHVGAIVSGNGGGCSSVATTFNVEATTFWGQNVYVVGNVAELGSWNTSNAVLLSPDNYPIWSGTVNLPAETSIEFKYVKIDGGNVVWESGSNRQLTTGCGGSTTTSGVWRN